MRKPNRKAGFVVTSELLLISSILTIGLIVGWVTVRNSVNAELEDFAEAIGDLDQSYSFAGVLNDNGTAVTSGSRYEDELDDFAADSADGNIDGVDNNWSFIEATSGEDGASLPATGPLP